MNSLELKVLTIKQNILITILGITGIGIILLVTHNYGAGLSPDSTAYIAVARNMAEGKGFLMSNGDPFILWPPLFPALLGAVDYLFRIDPLISARIINSILFGLIVYLSGVLFLKKLTSSISFAFLCTIYIITSNQLVEVSLWALTEPLFICFVLLYLIYFDSYLIKKDTTSLILLSFSVALACLTRYIGIILIITGIISILLFRKDYFKAKIQHLIIFIFVSCLPISIWMIRNFFLSGTLTGPRAPFSYTFDQGLNFIFSTFLSWYIPGKITENGLILILLSSVILLLFGINIKNIWKKERTLLLNIGPVILFVILYWIALIIFHSDVFENRFSSPVFVPVTFLLCFFIEQLFKPLTHRFKPNLVKIFLVFIIILLSLVSVKRTISLAANYMENGGWGYNNKMWRNNETINYLLKHSPIISGRTIYTNDRSAIFILTNRVTQWAPRHEEWKTNEIFKLINMWPKEDMALLVWFDNIRNKYLFTINELQGVVNISEIIRLKDGTIYSVKKKE